MEYHLAIKKGTKLCHLQQHGPRDCHTESSQTQEDKYCMILLMYSVTPLCLTVCDPMDCHLPGCSVHGIFQARTLEWVAISYSRYCLYVESKKKVQMNFFTKQK